MNISLKKTEAALVLPVYSANTSFLKIINDNCMELAIAIPDVNWTVIIINDGSRIVPSQIELFKNLSPDINYYYYHSEVRLGFNKAADADVFIYTDCDFPFSTQAVISAVNILRQKEVDIVVGDRSNHYLSFLPFPRKIITRLTRISNAKVFKLNFTDTQAGLKGMNNRSLPLMLHTAINGFLFDLQFIKNAEKQPLQIHALPVTCANDIEVKNFGLSIIYTELKNLFSLLFKKEKKKNTHSSYSGSGEICYSTEIRTNTFTSKGDQDLFVKKSVHSAI